MNIARLLGDIFFMDLDMAYGVMNNRFQNMETGFFCIEDWGPWR